MLKVVNTTVPENNPFHQVYHITTFGVVFYNPPGLTVRSCIACSIHQKSNMDSSNWEHDTLRTLEWTETEYQELAAMGLPSQGP